MINKEVQRRIRVSLAALAYEIYNNEVEIMSDAEYDAMCKEINVNTPTGNNKLDIFFKEHFTPNTGQWIYKHPEIHKLHWMYQKYFLKWSDKKIKTNNQRNGDYK